MRSRSTPGSSHPVAIGDFPQGNVGLDWESAFNDLQCLVWGETDEPPSIHSGRLKLLADALTSQINSERFTL